MLKLYEFSNKMILIFQKLLIFLFLNDFETFKFKYFEKKIVLIKVKLSSNRHSDNERKS